MALQESASGLHAVQKIQEAAVKPRQEVAVVPSTTDASPIKRSFPNLMVTDGVVTLKGTVKDDAGRRNFFMTMEKTPGVRSVTNQLVLKPSGPGSTS